MHVLIAKIEIMVQSEDRVSQHLEHDYMVQRYHNVANQPGWHPLPHVRGPEFKPLWWYFPSISPEKQRYHCHPR